jgi:cyanophycinase
MTYPKGTLIAIGGNEDKGFGTDESYSLDFIEEGILSHVVSRAGGNDAVIKVITSASSIPEEVGIGYEKAFKKLSCTNVEMLHIKTKKQANHPETLQKLLSADAVLFSGGDQRVLSKIYRKSEFLTILKERYMSDNFVIAGTSAGAVAMSLNMVCGGSSAYSMLKGAVKMMPGLGLLEKVIFDSHFIKRGRFGRLTEAVSLHPGLLGVGLGEDTGIIITNGNCFQTIGSGMVILFDGTQFTHNTAKKLKPGTPISISNMVVHVLANGDKYYLDEKKVDILPMDAPFV